VAGTAGQWRQLDRDTLNSFTIVSNTGNRGCRASVLLPMPLPVGPIAPSSTRSVEVPVSFVPLKRVKT
jgi:hypothetical protein